MYFQIDTNTNRIIVLNPTREEERINSFAIDQILEFYSSTTPGEDAETTIFCVDKQDIRLTLVDKVGDELGGKELANALGFLCNRPATFIGMEGETSLYDLPTSKKGVNSSLIESISYLPTGFMVRLQVDGDKIIIKGDRWTSNTFEHWIGFVQFVFIFLVLLITGPLAFWYVTDLAFSPRLMTDTVHTASAGVFTLVWVALGIRIRILMLMKPIDQAVDWIMEIKDSRLTVSKFSRKSEVPVVLDLDKISNLSVGKNNEIVAHSKIPLVKPLSFKGAEWMQKTLNMLLARQRS